MLRIAGVLILVQLVTSVPHTISELVNYGGPETRWLDTLWLSAMALALPLAIGLLLIYFPSVVANRVVHLEEPLDGKGSTESLLPLALACLGVYFVCAAMYDGVYWYSKVRLYYLVTDKLGWSGSAPAIMPAEFAGIVATFTQFIIGIVLALGAKGVGRLVMKMRSF